MRKNNLFSFENKRAALKTMESCQITVINKPEEY